MEIAEAAFGAQAVQATPFFFVPLHRFLVATDGSSCRGDESLWNPSAALDQFSMDLGLTQQQRQQITPIIQQEAPKLEALKKGTTIKPVDKLEQLKQIADDLDGKITPLLNADQQKKFQEIREESQSEFTSVRPQSVRRPAEAARRRAGDTR